MRVLLVHPPFQIFRNMRNTDFPLGLGYIAAILKLDGHDVVIYNGEYGSSYAHITKISDRLGTSKKAIENLEAQPYRDFKKAIDSFGPDVVGMSVYSQSYKAAVNLSKIVKASFRDCLVVVGGPHVTVAPDSLMEIPSIDVAVMFEGEYAMQQIIRNFANHKRTFENIPGVIFKYNGVVNRNKPAKRIDNLDLLPFPVRNVYLGDIVNLTPSQKRLFIKRNNSVMITSRGCPYACKFCSCKNI